MKSNPDIRRSILLSPKPKESAVEYWKRINASDKSDIKLYCQSCCYRYPDECPEIRWMHPYDRAAESCPDFIPKDYYKPKSKAKCWLKRLKVDPNWRPLPDCELRHPILFYPFISSSAYYKIMTKIKASNYVDYLKRVKK